MKKVLTLGLLLLSAACGGGGGYYHHTTYHHTVCSTHTTRSYGHTHTVRTCHHY